MIIIICHNDNIPERQYAIDVLFSTLMGLGNDAYRVVFSETAENYCISNDSVRLIIEDHFFANHPEPLSYLKSEHIPSELQFFHMDDFSIPMIYGVDKYEVSQGCILIGLDVFASTFFMLSRWEEYLMGREEKGDCDESKLFAVKHGIHQRAIVHEYELLLRTALRLPPSQRQYRVVLSHDVDGFVTPSWQKIAKDIIKQTLKGKPKNTVLNLTWREEIKYKKAFPSAFCQFDIYANLAEKYQILEWFYYKVCAKGETECTYLYDDKILSEIVGRYNEQNMSLGFHPSQSTFDNLNQWNKESLRVKKLLNGPITIGRNHHLLFNMSMLRAWESLTKENEVLHLSNCVFHRRQGFRSGIATPYPLFDIFERRQMGVYEHPCQIMDTVVRYDTKVKSEKEIWEDIKAVVGQVQKWNGELVLTWHIYIRNAALIKKYLDWCEKTIAYATGTR